MRDLKYKGKVKKGRKCSSTERFTLMGVMLNIQDRRDRIDNGHPYHLTLVRLKHSLLY